MSALDLLSLKLRMVELLYSGLEIVGGLVFDESALFRGSTLR